MGAQQSKNEDIREEVIIAQNGAGNSAIEEKSEQHLPSLVYMVAVLVAIISIIAIYLAWKKINECLTKKIERQAVAVVMRKQSLV